MAMSALRIDSGDLMNPFVRAGAAVLAGTAFAAAPGQAGASARHRVVRVPCASPALAGAITAAGSTPSVLRLAPSCTYLLTAALPQVTGDIALVGGPSTTIKRGPAAPDVRLLDVAVGGRLRVRGIALLNGATSTAPGGGIRNAGALVLDHVTLTGNSSLGNDGGGLYNTGSAVVSHSLIVANVTRGGAGDRDGGGIYNDGSLTVFLSRLSGNIAVHDGGGVFTAAGRTTRIIRSTVEGNTAADVGGGIADQGRTIVVRSLVRFNLALGGDGSGGGIVNGAGGTVVRGSVVYRNSPDDCFPLNSVAGCVG
jgi:hypothetical protein